MAAEFSRELGEKVTRGKTRLARMGFWMGSTAGYGYRRLMVSAEGLPKQLLKLGEQKSLTTDRVILVLGPKAEVEVIRKIFSLAIAGVGSTEISRQLNAMGVTFNGKPWITDTVRYILSNPKYAGWNAWHRRTQRLRGSSTPVEPKDWITKQGAFAAIVDQSTFDRAQANQPRTADRLWSDEEILRGLRKLLARNGRLSETLILKARNLPVPTTLHKRFGTYREIYKAVGFQLPDNDFFGNRDAQPTMLLRRGLVTRIRDMFPENITITHLPNKSRSILRIDDSFLVSVILCRRVGPKPYWLVIPNKGEASCITLLCRLDASRKRIISYHVFSRVEIPGRFHCSYKYDPWLKGSTRLASLSDFYSSVRRLWDSNATGSQP
jgi:hypothetical protein